MCKAEGAKRKSFRNKQVKNNTKIAQKMKKHLLLGSETLR